MNKAHDIDLRKDIMEGMEWDPSIDARTIGVAVEDGIVSLTGHVPNYAEKTNSEKIVKRVHGVLGVANDIEVKLPLGAAKDDVDIVRSVINALEWNVAVQDNRVKVTVSKGWVTLDGEVEWYYQKNAAEEAVRLLASVRGVSNRIVVKAKQARAEDVKGQIEAALKRNAELDARKINVIAKEGRVTLSGTVRSWIGGEDA